MLDDLRGSESDLYAELRKSAQSKDPVTGLTHCHFKYPARFSPQFVASALEQFSRPGDLVLDPYMGGGTTVVEALARSRLAVGCDINSLAVFVTRVKCASLSSSDYQSLRTWAQCVVPGLSYHSTPPGLESVICAIRTRNLTMPRARPFKKLIALALASITEFESEVAQEFARCAVLNASQWALDGRKSTPSLDQFRARLEQTTLQMLESAGELGKSLKRPADQYGAPTLIHDSAENLARHSPFHRGRKVDLVITSPPYPGVHVLYHRWQVDGRRETPAPYWIANCLDGQGASYYTFGDRKQADRQNYFDASLRTLHGIRAVMRCGAVIVQMVAFSNPERQLPRYLKNMREAGFREMEPSNGGSSRIWREVPGRNWHATLQGKTSSAREVVLVHSAE